VTVIGPVGVEEGGGGTVETKVVEIVEKVSFELVRLVDAILVLLDAFTVLVGKGAEPSSM